MKHISKLHFITASAEKAEMACAGGADWIQLRLKNVSYAYYRETALAVQDICKKYKATFIINDIVQLALDLKADGVHIGKEDMSPDEARQLMGGDFIIGCTANTTDDIFRLAGKQIDYIGLGPYRFTTTKQNLSPVLGLEGYQTIFQTVTDNNRNIPPVVGIGGILEDDINDLLSTGLHGIAISGAIANAEDATAAARKIKSIINEFSKQRHTAYVAGK
jgi:thiamine-phosphate pyrophosphorylase